MAYEGYQFLKIRVDRGVTFVTIDNPPINLLTLELCAELVRLAGEILADDQVRVTVFDSANPDFFIAHFDVNVLAMLGGQPLPPTPELNDLCKVTEIFRRMPKVSIAKIEGRTRGGGSEFVLGLDMRFGAIGKAVLGVVVTVVGGENDEGVFINALLLELGDDLAAGGVHLGGEAVIVFHHFLILLGSVEAPVPAVAALVLLGEEIWETFP